MDTLSLIHISERAGNEQEKEFIREKGYLLQDGDSSTLYIHENSLESVKNKTKHKNKKCWTLGPIQHVSQGVWLFLKALQVILHAA